MWIKNTVSISAPKYQGSKDPRIDDDPLAYAITGKAKFQSLAQRLLLHGPASVTTDCPSLSDHAGFHRGQLRLQRCAGYRHL
ncbi:hypothetical protein M378DRAFT_158241, partial [Amanita muscaria Koide BX008]